MAPRLIALFKPHPLMLPALHLNIEDDDMRLGKYSQIKAVSNMGLACPGREIARTVLFLPIIRALGVIRG